MNRKEISEIVFKKIESYKRFNLKVIDKKSLNGYYLFDMGEDSVWHFKIKGLKNWLWGMWITLAEDFKPGDKEYEENLCHISLFGEYIDYIDKFKPTATSIAYDFKCKEDEESIKGALDIFTFAEKVSHIKDAPAIMRYAIYGEGEKFIPFLVSNFCYYKITKKWKKFVRKVLTKYYLKFIAKIYTWKFKTPKNKFHVVVDERDLWYPNYEFRLIYEQCDNDNMWDIYHFVEREKFHKATKKNACYSTRYNWLIPKWADYNSRVIHCYSDGDKRGFYYNE